MECAGARLKTARLLGAFSTNKTKGKIPACATDGKYAIICGVKGKMAVVAGSPQEKGSRR